MSDNTAIFDRAAALDRVGGDLELLIELAGMFVEDCPHVIDSLERAVKQGDSDAIFKSAHTLKGAVGNFSAQAAYDAALQLETAGRTKELDRAGEAFDTLKSELEKLEPLLNSL